MAWLPSGVIDTPPVVPLAACRATVIPTGTDRVAVTPVGPGNRAISRPRTRTERGFGGITPPVSSKWGDILVPIAAGTGMKHRRGNPRSRERRGHIPIVPLSFNLAGVPFGLQGFCGDDPIGFTSQGLGSSVQILALRAVGRLLLPSPLSRWREAGAGWRGHTGGRWGMSWARQRTPWVPRPSVPPVSIPRKASESPRAQIRPGPNGRRPDGLFPLLQEGNLGMS